MNVSRFGNRLAGVGGFVNISQNARRVVFCGCFTPGGLEVEIADGVLQIRREGDRPKFVQQVQQISFSGDLARRTRRDVLYVTERAVFRLVEAGLELIEVAPGVDAHRDVLDRMEFRPLIRDVQRMPCHLFARTAQP